MAEISKIEQYVIDNVREKRIKAGLTQVVLSIAMDISSKFVGNVESAKTTAKYNINHLNKLAVIFDCSIKDFFPEKPFMDDISEHTKK
jgi:transcriptional regulator with XRE-family HTH domain